MVDQTEPEEFGGEKPNGQHVLDDVDFSASISLKLLEKKRQRLRCFEPVPVHVARQRQRAALCITIDNDQFFRALAKREERLERAQADSR